MNNANFQLSHAKLVTTKSKLPCGFGFLGFLLGIRWVFEAISTVLSLSIFPVFASCCSYEDGQVGDANINTQEGGIHKEILRVIGNQTATG